GENQPAVVAQVTQLATLEPRGWMPLDPQTARNLELFEAARGGGKAGSLLAAIDGTKTPMGARLLRRRLGRPLTDVEEIRRRLDAVTWCHERGQLRAGLLTALARVGDLERAITRIAAGSTAPRELLALRKGLEQTEAIRCLLRDESPPELPPLADLTEALDIIEQALAA